MKVDLAPVGKLAGDGLVRFTIVIHQIVERLVGEDHAEAEGVVSPMALVDCDVVAREALLHQQREIKAAGTSADDDDLHAPVSESSSLELSSLDRFYLVICISQYTIAASKNGWEAACRQAKRERTWQSSKHQRRLGAPSASARFWSSSRR